MALACTFAGGAFSQSGFTNQDFRGTYAYSFEGTLIRVSTNTPIPVVALGTFTLDGEGKVTKAVRHINVGGQLVRETATGTYSVGPDGVGTATFIVIPLAGEPPVVPPTREVFHVVFRDRQRGFGISSTIRAADGTDIGFVSLIRTEFVRQDIP